MSPVPTGKRTQCEAGDPAVQPGEIAGTASLASSRSLALAGFIGTAIAFGPARMGFGLFLPTISEEFALSASAAGVIASCGFAAFLAALLLAAWTDIRIGPRFAVMVGTLLATTGFTMVATANHVGMLAAGVALAGSSAGFCWTPFNDAAKRVVPGGSRPEALSVVATGTTLGVAATGALALAVSFGLLDWRTAWILFAGTGLLAALAAKIGMPRGLSHQSRLPGLRAIFWRSANCPLFASAFLFGVANAAYISFAADSVVRSGGLTGLPDDAAAAVIFISYGGFGTIGIATGRLEARLGTGWLLAGLFSAFAVSLVLLAIAPGTWPGVVLSAGLHGAGVMVISGLLSFWSLRLFPRYGSLGFSAALVLMASGSVLGAALAGSLIDQIGMKATFLVLASPLILAALATAMIASLRSSKEAGNADTHGPPV